VTGRGECSRGPSTRAGGPLSDETSEKIIVRAMQEMSVRAIAAAAAAQKVQAEADRAELAALARDELARLRRPHREYWGFGGATPVVLSQLMPEPPPRARRDLIARAMALVDRSEKLRQGALAEDYSNVDAWLAGILGEPEQP
jgi:hypothetical protein